MKYSDKKVSLIFFFLSSVQFGINMDTTDNSRDLDDALNSETESTAEQSKKGITSYSAFL